LRVRVTGLPDKSWASIREVRLSKSSDTTR
jgi:hypothetical protein